MIDECSVELENAVAQDLSKHKYEVNIYELEPLKRDAKFAIQELKKWTTPEKLPLNTMAFLDRGYVEKVPFGLVLILGAWNYPILLTLQPMLGAIASGNCVIVKPSEVSPNVSALLARIVPQYMDLECYHIVQGGPEEVQQLLTNKFDYIFYTGSSEIARRVMSAAAMYLTPVTLELGGKSPVYVDDSSNIEIAAKRILWGRFLNLGQTCVSPEYVLCSKRVQFVFMKVAEKIMKEWFGTNPKGNLSLSRIVNENHCHRLQRLLRTTKGRIAIGGQVDVQDRWVQPTVVVNVASDDALMTEEIFGPILPIVNVNSVNEAIQFINAGPRPLAIYTFSNNDKTNQKIVSETHSGGICINDVMWQAVWHGLPFGGVGDSGMGRYHGKASFDTFTHHRSVLSRSANALSEKLGEPRYLPYTRSKAAFTYFIIRHFDMFNFRGWSMLTHFLAFIFGIILIGVFH